MRINDQYILVIGAAHIDVFANYVEELSSHIDKPGKINFSLGGTAFNIAADLAFSQEIIYIITAVNPHKISGLCVEASLKARKINSNFIVRNSHFPEGAFVALIQNGDLVSAVTQTTTDELNPDEKTLENAINNASIVVADCNLNDLTLTRVVEYCFHFRKPILVAGVSENKAVRITSLPDYREIDVFSLNYKEAIHLLNECQEIVTYFFSNNEDIKEIETWSSATIKEVCSKLRTKYLIITKGKNGYLVLSKGGNLWPFPAVKLIGEFKSSSGAGDALLAGVTQYYRQYYKDHNWEPDWSGCSRIIEKFVKQVLCIEEASLSNATEPPLVFIEEMLCKKDENYKSKQNQVYLFSFFVVLAVLSMGLAFVGKLDALIVLLLSIIIFSTLLIHRFISEEVFLKLVRISNRDSINK